jgi:hypothetical protein
MKKLARASSARSKPDLSPEYEFDYSKAKPNRFAGRSDPEPVIIALAPDVAKVFKDAESVNSVLRSILKAMPPTR